MPNSSTSNPKWSHDMFLRYNTHYNLSNLMYTTLVQRGFSTFRDDNLYQGESCNKCLLASNRLVW